MLRLQSPLSFGFNQVSHCFMTEMDLSNPTQIFSRVLEAVTCRFTTTHLTNTWAMAVLINPQPCIYRSKRPFIR